MIKFCGVTKKYGEHTAIKNISFCSGRGGVLGVVGESGSGKSVLADLLCGVSDASSGEIYVDGINISKEPVGAKRKIGYLPSPSPLYDDMTCFEYLCFIGEAKGVGRDRLMRNIKSALDIVALDERESTLCARLTEYEKTMLGLAGALLGSPELIVLDEPYGTLSDSECASLSRLIRKLGGIKTVALLTSRYDACLSCCDKLMRISGGSVGEIRDNTAPTELVGEEADE